MLDQNTDRMWFVIGAVIVGAAIIFIANGSLPTLFASVTDSFERTSLSAKAGMESVMLGVEGDGINLLSNPTFATSSLNNINNVYGDEVVSGGMLNSTFTKHHWATRFEKRHVINTPGEYTYTIRARFNDDVGHIAWMNFVNADMLGGSFYKGAEWVSETTGIFTDTAGSNNIAHTQDTSDDWQVFSVPFRVDKPGTVVIRGYVPSAQPGESFQINWEKLETGTKATLHDMP